MAGIVLRPDMKTAGGEVIDILFRDRYVGKLIMVYREKDRISGSVQLEKEALSSKDKKAVMRHITKFVQSTIYALKATECDILVTHSSYDRVIETDADRTEMAEAEGLYDDEPEVVWVTDENDLGDWDVSDRETIRMGRPDNRPGNGQDAAVVDDRNAVYYELVSTKESNNKMEYHVYDQDRRWVAEVFMRLIGPDVVGDIHWMSPPQDEQIEHVTDLVVSDFDPDQIDTFTIDHRHEGNIIETVELTHEDLLDGNKDIQRNTLEEEYTVVLVRDDQDMLTYEIYKQLEGGLPIGTATVDISRRQLSGFIDFRSGTINPGEREKIATLVMQELDKEKSYDVISFTMLQGNKPIDEIVFENETVH